MISMIQLSGSSYIYTAGLTLCMGTACLGAEHASLSFASQPTWTVRATQRRERGKDLHRVHELHLPWACDGISTLEGQRSPRLSLHEPCQFRNSFSGNPGGSVPKRHIPVRLIYAKQATSPLLLAELQVTEARRQVPAA